MLRSATAGLGYREYFGNDVIAEGNITQRIDANDELPLCPYEVRIENLSGVSWIQFIW